MDKRTLLAMALSGAVLFFFSVFPMGGTKKLDAPVPEKSAQSVSAVKPSDVAPATTAPIPVPVTRATPNATERETTVVTDLFTAVFSSRGASLKKLTLNKYREEAASNAELVVLGANADPNLFNFTTQATGFNLPSNTNYNTNSDSVKLTGSEEKQLIFNYISNQGFTVRKIYTFNGSSYGIKLDTQVFNNSAAPLVGTVQHIMTYPAEPKVVDSRYETAGAYLYANKSIEINKNKDVSSASKKYENKVLWAGFADKFFLTSIMSENGNIAVAEVKKGAAGFLETIVSTPQFVVNSGQSTTLTNRIFVGPKDLYILKAQGNSLEASLDLGWFSAIATPLLYTLKFLYDYVGNYGLAIIIITVVLKALFFPLTHKSYKSMKDMQKIQPVMAELKEKYKDDRETMNKKVMELYKDNKVNPLGGCLPMVVQIPVFFALYKALMFSIELRHAPFYLWITDLSGPDNLIGHALGLPFVLGPLPVVMGATMFIQQKMTPTSMDPMQEKMMLALPLVFTVMFLSFPSGLVLYWLINNVLTIAQQMYINKQTT